MSLKAAGFGFFFVSLLAVNALAQASSACYAPPRDRHAIRAMAGCYEATFDFAETIPLKEGYHPRAPFRTRGLEWIVVDQDSGNRITLQHVLVSPQGPQKHWRQEWEMSAESVFEYKGDSHWTKRSLTPEEREGRWVQRVFQSDDSPRYECSAPWVHWGDNVYWECEAWSPLAQHELAQRSDYNVLDQRNRHAIRSGGWIQEQDNVKLQVSGETRTALVKEKGESFYHRVDDRRCSSAQVWWEKNKVVWNAIQAAWKDVYASRDHLQFKKAADQEGLQLTRKLFDLGDRAERTGLRAEEIQREARALINAELD